jgi:hypothetical protein|tara:strand:+ start:1005 stop:1505 length:501 start_codon:yes stop_codon:yes gene_type:complete
MTYQVGAILATTDGEVRRVEYHRFKHPLEFSKLVSEVGVDVGLPLTAAKESEDVYRFVYPRQDRPSIFNEDHEVYSLRVTKSTGAISGKAYDFGNTLNKVEDFTIVATGIYLDEDKYTLYHTIDGSEMEDIDTLTISTPYAGTTYNADGTIYRTTQYSVQTNSQQV